MQRIVTIISLFRSIFTVSFQGLIISEGASNKFLHLPELSLVLGTWRLSVETHSNSPFGLFIHSYPLPLFFITRP